MSQNKCSLKSSIYGGKLVKGKWIFSINGGGKQGEEGRKIVKLDILKLFTIRKLPDLSKIE